MESGKWKIPYTPTVPKYIKKQQMPFHCQFIAKITRGIEFNKVNK